MSPAATQQLAGRRILVVGANGGVGAALAKACANDGATVVLMGRRVAALERLYDEIERLGAPQPAIYPLNLEGATPADFDELSVRLADGLGGLDHIVHAATRLHGLTPIELTDGEEWLRTWQVNLHAPYFLWRALLPLLRQSQSPSILALVDSSERHTAAYWGAYGIAQCALRALLAMAASEWQSDGIRVFGVEPPPMATALRRKVFVSEAQDGLAAPEAVAAALVTLIARAAEVPSGSVTALELSAWK